MPITSLRLGALTLTLHKSTDFITQWPVHAGGGGWWGVLRESFAGAWQRGAQAPVQDVLTHSTVWACVTLIAADISKLRIKLVAQDEHGIWTETESPAFSPVLRKPNHYQTRIKFVEGWVTSKLVRGNAYILKERDNRGLVNGMYVLDPSRVQVLVAPNGEVFYDLSTDYLSGIGEASVRVPAREIIHDIMVALYHPLIGVSPFHACGRAAIQGLKIQQNSEKLFENGSQPGGVLTAPGPISEDAAKRMQAQWDANFGGPRNVGRVAVLGNGLKYEPMAMTAVDAQLIEQLKWGDEKVCSTLHVPPYMVGVGSMPTYTNIEALNQQYYAQCLQNLIECIELLLDEGLELPKPYGTEMDVEGGLLRMDTATRVKAAGDSIKGGMKVNEARQLYYGLGPVEGGDAVYLQQQDFSIAALAKRDALSPAPSTMTPPPPQPPAVPAPPAAKADEWSESASMLVFAVRAKALGLPVADLEQAA